MSDLVIPERLLIFTADDWPGKDPGHMMGIDALVRREQWRRAQDQWSHEHDIWRDRFEQLQRDQLAARQENH